MKRIKYSLMAGFIAGIAMLGYCYLTSKSEVAIVLGIYSFVFFSLVSYFKLFSGIRDNIVFQKIDKKNVIYSGLTNHYYNGISVGGRLYLLSDKLIFQTNMINFTHKHELIIKLNEIKAIYFPSTSTFIENENLVIEIAEINDKIKKERFLVKNKQKWKDLIKCNLELIN